MAKRKHEQSDVEEEEEDTFDFDNDIEIDESADESGDDDNSSMESSDSDDDESGLDDDDPLASQQQTKTKKPKTSKAFSEAMTNILASHLRGADRKDPIMARSKGTERKIEDEKLEHKARKVLAAEKKALKEKGRVIPDYTTFEYEKRLRKVATRGVVKLFNAIRIQQRTTEVAVTEVAEHHKTRSALEKAKNVSTMSKSNFLDLLKSGQS